MALQDSVSTKKRVNKYILAALCLCLIPLTPVSVSGFAPATFVTRGAHHFGARFEPNAARYRLQMAESIAEEERDTDKKQATLVLKGEYSKTTEPAPISSPEDMTKFFADPENRNCFVTAGHRLDVEVIDSTIGLIQKWREQAASVGATEPDLDDVLISVQTGGLNMPGIKILTTARIGCKLIPPNDSSTFPSFEFVSIDDKTEATGLKPVVWIFNQLTGAGKKDAGGRTSHSSSSLSRVTVQPTAKEDEITFNLQCFLEVQVNFPAFLLRILPVSKEKGEQQGGDAIVKALSRDIGDAMAAFYEAYCATVASSR